MAFYLSFIYYSVCFSKSISDSRKIFFNCRSLYLLAYLLIKSSYVIFIILLALFVLFASALLNV